MKIVILGGTGLIGSALQKSFSKDCQVQCFNRDAFKSLENLISIIEGRKKPNWLPPQPFLNIGIYTRLAYERIKARSET